MSDAHLRVTAGAGASRRLRFSDPHRVGQPREPAHMRPGGVVAHYAGAARRPRSPATCGHT